MNITKTMCKWFDKEKKGYVTLGDIVFYTFDRILYGSSVLLFVAIVIGMLYSMYLSITTSRELLQANSPILLIGWLGWLVVLMFVLVALSEVKVVVCKLSEPDNKEKSK